MQGLVIRIQAKEQHSPNNHLTMILHQFSMKRSLPVNLTHNLQKLICLSYNFQSFVPKIKMFQHCLCQISSLPFLTDPHERLILSSTEVVSKKREKKSLKLSKTQTNSCRSSFMKEIVPKQPAKLACSIEYSIVGQVPIYHTTQYGYPSSNRAKSQQSLEPTMSSIPTKYYQVLPCQNLNEKTWDQKPYSKEISADKMQSENPIISNVNDAQVRPKTATKLSEIAEEKNNYPQRQEFSFAPHWHGPKTIVSMDSSRHSECDSVVIGYPLQVSRFNKLI